MAIAERVVAGTLWVNCFFVRELAAPFGGARDSGIGREGGTLELRLLLRREERRGPQGFVRLERDRGVREE